MEQQHVGPDYRGRDQMSLVEFIEDVEKCHFRTNHDTGANPNALFIWNIVRSRAGLARLTEQDLEQRYADDMGVSLEEFRRRDAEFNAAQERRRQKAKGSW